MVGHDHFCKLIKYFGRNYLPIINEGTALSNRFLLPSMTVCIESCWRGDVSSSIVCLDSESLLHSNSTNHANNGELAAMVAVQQGQMLIVSKCRLCEYAWILLLMMEMLTNTGVGSCWWSRPWECCTCTREGIGAALDSWSLAEDLCVMQWHACLCMMYLCLPCWSGSKLAVLSHY